MQTPNKRKMTVVAILISNKVNFEAKSTDWNISTLNLYTFNNMKKIELEINEK